MGITQPKPHPQPNIAGSPPSDRNTLQEPKFIEVGSFTPFSFDPTSLGNYLKLYLNFKICFFLKTPNPIKFAYFQLGNDFAY